MSTPSNVNVVAAKMLPELFLGEVTIKDAWRSPPFTISVIRPRESTLLLNEDFPSLGKVLDELTQVTADSFGTPLDEHSSDGTRSHIQAVNGLAVLFDREGIAGFASAFFPKEELFYLHGVAITERAKGRGMAPRMVGLLRQASGMEDMAFTTQNPSMFCLLRSMCRETYPSPNSALPEDFQDRARKLLRDRRGSFDSSGVVRGLYGQCLYPRIPRSGDPKVNAWFDEMLEVESGRTEHGFILIGRGTADRAD